MAKTLKLPIHDASVALDSACAEVMALIADFRQRGLTVTVFGVPIHIELSKA